ncbi:MAG: glycosyl transferase family 1 [Betaproteobacteria bacterium]|nr:MAG: glycosyl transferase family 1 [Betaproteobacteria bacterium]
MHRTNGQAITRPHKVLWIAEAVTLAHVARPLAARRSLDSGGWTSAIACDPRAKKHLDAFEGEYIPLASIEPKQFLQALRAGTPVYDEATLARYVEADLELISKVKPDVVIGDFRLSLSVSARLAGVPYATLASACWSPYYLPASWPVPELPLTHLLPLPIARALFRIARPVAFALHASPMNRVRRKFGLAPLGHDLRRIYTDADFVLYADLPELYPLGDLPSNHRFVGPPLWEPAGQIPDRWASPQKDRPAIYVTLGSSGTAALLPSIVATLSAMPVMAMVATAAQIQIPTSASHVLVREMLPGIEAAKHSKLVICNGGGLTCYQALSAGIPVIGIASNLDQFLNMQAVERAGAGLTLRADRFSGPELEAAVNKALNDTALRRRAGQAREWCEKHALSKGIRAFLAEFGDAPHSPSSH